MQKILNELNRLKDACESERRDPTAEERQQADRLLARLTILETQDLLEVRKPDRPNFSGGVGDDPQTSSELGGPAVSRDFRSMFYKGACQELSKGDFKDANEFLEIVASGRHDPRLKRASQIEGLGSLGGFAVPEQFSAEWLDDSLPNEIVRPLCQVWPMTSSTRKIPGWDGADMSSGELFGGFAMEFLGEEQTATKQNAKVRLIQLTAKKGAIFCDVSSELEADGLGFEEQLTTALMKSIGYGVDKYCLRGTGAGQPLGVFNSPCLISVAKEAGQAADSIVYGNLTKMFARQLNKSRAVWLFNDDCVPELMNLEIPVGVGGSHFKVMNESNGKFTIFGRPVFFTSHMPTLGDEHDCGFIDFGAYALGMRKEMTLDKSNAPGWTEDLISYRILVRFDGMGVLSEAITPENGATLSPFVSLDERA